MSPRILHFTPTQVLWECTSSKHTQGLPSVSTPIQRPSARPLDVLSSLHAHSQWHHTLTSYTTRKLTDYTDTFPALSGLAQSVVPYLPEKEEYVVGMWSSHLRAGLAWCGEKYGDARRHETYIAPSWSWTSIVGCIIHFNDDNLDGPDSAVHEPGTTVSIDNYAIQLATPDPFGPLAAAELHVRAPVVDLILDWYDAASHYFLHSPAETQRGKCVGEMRFDVPDEGRELKVVRCVALYSDAMCTDHGRVERPVCGVGIAVVRVGGEGDVYRRVGRVWCLRLSCFEGVGEESVVLV